MLAVLVPGVGCLLLCFFFARLGGATSLGSCDEEPSSFSARSGASTAWAALLRSRRSRAWATPSTGRGSENRPSSLKKQARTNRRGAVIQEAPALTASNRAVVIRASRALQVLRVLIAANCSGFMALKRGVCSSEYIGISASSRVGVMP